MAIRSQGFLGWVVMLKAAAAAAAAATPWNEFFVYATDVFSEVYSLGTLWIGPHKNNSARSTKTNPNSVNANKPAGGKSPRDRTAWPL